MSDIRKYINIIEQELDQETFPDTPTISNDYGTSKYVSLIENAMRVDESFKDAQSKFSEEADDEQEVKKYIDKFKELAKKNVIKGQDKDIGKWIKAGWEDFKALVDKSSEVKTKRQFKKKVKEDAIMPYEDENVKVVIPLSKPASCEYGRNTKWCTAATDTENHFNEYFGKGEITLFYVFVKDTNKKYAVAFDDSGTSDYFDEMDSRITDEHFEEATGISNEQLQQWYQDDKETIEKARSKFSPLGMVKHTMEQYKNGEFNWSMVVATVNEQLHELEDNRHDIEISGIDDDGMFVVDVEFIIDETESLTKYLNGDDDLDINIDYIDYDDIFDSLDTEWQIHLVDYLLSNYRSEIEEILDDEDITRNDVERGLNEIMEADLIDDTKEAFNNAYRDATESYVMGQITEQVLYYINDQARELNLAMSKTLFDLIDGDPSLPIDGNDMAAFFESVEDFELENFDDSIDFDGTDNDYMVSILKEQLKDIIGEPKE